MSLVQSSNWSSSTETTFQSSLHKAKSRSDLICSKHKAKKFSLLLHEIEGFIIEESNVPFKEPVELEDEEIQKVVEISEHDRIEIQQNEEDKENEIIEASVNSYPEDKDELMSLLPTKCKYCRGDLPEDRAMWGKRFCSVSCGKKYSSKRVKKHLQRRSGQTTGPGRGRKRKISAENKDNTEFLQSPKSSRGRNRLTSTPSSTHVDDDSLENIRPPSSGYESLDTSDLQFAFPPRDPLGFGLDEHDLENELYDEVEPITKYSIVPMVTWSIDKVVEYIGSIPGCENCAQVFAEEEIDGRALLLLKMEHMVQTMNIKLGPALKIAAYLRDMKLEYGIATKSKYLSSPV